MADRGTGLVIKIKVTLVYRQTKAIPRHIFIIRFACCKRVRSKARFFAPILILLYIAVARGHVLNNIFYLYYNSRYCVR